MTDWLDELHQLREEDKAQRQADLKSLNLSVLTSQQVETTTLLLHRCDAHNLLRRLQKVLLDGKGTIDIFEQKSNYDRIITLAWQGPISAARIPDPEDPEDYNYIYVGVKRGKVYVNGEELSPVTPDALKPALVKAAKNPKVQTINKVKIKASSSGKA